MVWEKTPARAANIAKQREFLNNHFRSRAARGMSKRKITAQQRLDIQRRRYEGEDPKDLALEFGISAVYIAGTLAPWNARSSYGA